MKSVLTLIFTLGTTSAMALDFHCTKKVSETRAEGALIYSWPDLFVSTSFSECIKTDAGNHCSSGRLETIATSDQVCFREVDVNNDCTITETDSSFEVVCNNGSTLKFEVGIESLGQITCSEHGKVRKIWDVGVCTKN